MISQKIWKIWDLKAKISGFGPQIRIFLQGNSWQREIGLSNDRLLRV